MASPYLTPESSDDSGRSVDQMPVRRVGQRRPRQTGPRPKKRASPKGLRRLNLPAIIEGIGLVFHTGLGVLGKLVESVPNNPVKAIGLVAILIVMIFCIHRDDTGVHGERVCFMSIISLTFIAVGLVAVSIRNPEKDEQLHQQLHDRAKAVKVKSLRYKR